MSWNNKRVLVTGATGFIGSHLTEQLLAKGAILTCTHHGEEYSEPYRYISQLAQKNDHLTLVPCDIQNKDAVQNVIGDHEYVFHLAAQQDVRKSVDDPETCFATNARGTLNLLLAAKERQQKKPFSRIVLMSSATVYGNPQYVPVDEEHPLHANSPYAASKIAAEKFAESFYHSFGLSITVVRGFNAFGPMQQTAAVIPKVITQALIGRTVTLQGNVNAARDFIYVKDLADVLLAVATSPKTIGQTINAGSGSEISIQTLAESIIAIVNRKTGRSAKLELTAENAEQHPAEVNRMYANIKKLYTLTGWKAGYAFEAALEKTIDWFLEQQAKH